ncbi:MAG: metallophosphoesterase family protein [Chloroflexi bacterium]|nr:metallophosphoesterase family protein [Chloroflexota bacterium]
MRIGLISDTHIPGTGKEPPYQVARAFEGVDLILHAGDIYVPSCLDWLEQLAPVQAVEYHGSRNFDGDLRVSEQRTVEVDGHTIGMVHDFMLPGVQKEIRPGVIEADFPRNGSLSEAVQKVFGAPVNIVVFGHTHEAIVEDHQGVLFVNPGSPSLPKQLRRLGTVAILELTSQRPNAHIVDLATLGQP